MRMWMIPPEVMCKQHLLGEHVELHMFVGSLRRGTSMAGYITNGLLEPHSILQRHDALVAEMHRRGYNHKSPLDSDEVKRLIGQLAVKYREARVNRDAAFTEIKRRCPHCMKLAENAANAP